MVLWYSSSYQRRLFWGVLLIVGLLMILFLLFQHNREKHYKSDLMDAHLQDINSFVAMDLREGIPPSECFKRHHVTGMRLTLIDTLGVVLYDSEALEGHAFENHLNRSEVQMALQKGRGYTHRRLSRLTSQEYFYSALKDQDVIIRTAAPYDLSLIENLKVDNSYLLYLLPLLPLLLLFCYVATRRLSQNILHLKLLTQRLERGEEIEHIGPFANDELGTVSNHLLVLYRRLQRAKADAEREYATARYEEQEKDRIKRQLTNNINHELKTPVSAIRGYLESIIRNPEMDPAVREKFLQRSYEQVERLTSLLADVSTLTRVSDAPQQVAREVVDLRELIDEVTEELATKRPEGMTLTLDLPERIPLEGNIQLLQSIFHNLISNAFAYSGGTECLVRLSSQWSEGYSFEVSDNGSGVEEKHIEHLFERFYRIDKGRSRQLGGTGLGLAIVKHAVLFHGGMIEVRNRPEGGLLFVFTLARQMG